MDTNILFDTMDSMHYTKYIKIPFSIYLFYILYLLKIYLSAACSIAYKRNLTNRIKTFYRRKE